MTLPLSSNCDSTGPVKLSDGPFTVSPTLLASFRQCGHLALRCDSADTIVVFVSNDDMSVFICCEEGMKNYATIPWA